MKKPSEKEEEFFARQEAEKHRKLAEAKAHALAEAERVRLKELHFMRCPKCGMELEEIAYGDIKLDRCFECGGTWLDAGELEALAGAEARSAGVLKKLVSVFKD